VAARCAYADVLPAQPETGFEVIRNCLPAFACTLFVHDFGLFGA
jgi:hypothetical protein